MQGLEAALAALAASLVPGGSAVSLRTAGEPYLATEWLEGTLHADDLRRVARTAALDLPDLPDRLLVGEP